MSWHAIWKEGRTIRVPQADCERPLRAMTLWLELSGPRRPTRQRRGRRKTDVPLRLWQGRGTEKGRSIALYLMPDDSVRLVHGDIDLRSAPGTLRTGQTIGLRYVTCHEGRQDALEIVNYDQGQVQKLRAGLAHSATMAEALPARDGFLRVAHIAAIAPSVIPATDLPGIESGAIVATARGLRPVDALREGDLVLDASGAAHPIRWIEARPRLCMGRTAPMRLRAPYFGLARDLVVTPETRLLQSGPVVDYLCGTDAVLARLGDLANGSAVFRDRRKPIRTFFHLMLDDPACILVENCPVETAHLGDVMALGDPYLAAAAPDPRDMAPSLPLLDRATARALLTAHARAA